MKIKVHVCETVARVINTLHINDAFLRHWIVIKIELGSLPLNALLCHDPKLLVCEYTCLWIMAQATFFFLLF